MSKVKDIYLATYNKEIVKTIKAYADGKLSHTFTIFHILSICSKIDEILNKVD